MNRLALYTDTIAAIATPPGKGGVAIVKISGPDSLSAVRRFFTSRRNPERHARSMIYGHVTMNGDVIDEALVCYMKAPFSYTGEDVVEIQSHGGYAAAETIMSLLLDAGIRPAGPGEFTRRAFLNGRIDLAQAEGVMEIVSAENREHLKKAEHLLDGDFSRRIGHIVETLKKSLSLLEYAIDFQEQEPDTVSREEIARTFDELTALLDAMITSYKTGIRIRHGITVVLAGQPNSGKSSLFNAILGKKRAIVHHREGTTRDWIEEKLDLDGISVNLIDTAGLRETTCEIEREGVGETERLMTEADIVIRLHDCMREPEPQSESSGDTTIFIHISSKADLAEDPLQHHGMPSVSVKTGDGIENLRRAIIETARSLLHAGTYDLPVLVERHRTELAAAKTNIDNARAALEGWSEEIPSFEVNEAVGHLEAITGEHIDLDVLDGIFSRFCVGK